MWISFLNLIVLSTLVMANKECKKLDPLVVGDIGDYCVDCLQSTAFGTGRFVNRIPADRDVEDEEGNYLGSRDGYLCPECNFWECDRCDEKIYCDEDITVDMVYGDDTKREFSDGAYRVHEECLTKEEKEKFDEVCKEEESDYEKYKDDPRNSANDPKFKHLQKEKN